MEVTISLCGLVHKNPWVGYSKYLEINEDIKSKV
jgi:hypothetical protein